MNSQSQSQSQKYKHNLAANIIAGWLLSEGPAELRKTCGFLRLHTIFHNLIEHQNLSASIFQRPRPWPAPRYPSLTDWHFCIGCRSIFQSVHVAQALVANCYHCMPCTGVEPAEFLSDFYKIPAMFETLPLEFQPLVMKIILDRKHRQWYRDGTLSVESAINQ